MKYLFLLLMIPFLATAQMDIKNANDSKWLTNYDTGI